MPAEKLTHAPTPEHAAPSRLGVLLVVLAGLALLAPAMVGDRADGRIGLLLMIAGLVEILHGFRRSRAADQQAAWQSGIITVLMGGLVSQASAMVGGVVVLLLAGWFAVDAVRHLVTGLRGWKTSTGSGSLFLPALGNAAMVVALLLLRGRAGMWIVCLASALRILGTAWNIRAAAVYTAADSADTVLDDLGLQDHPQLVALGRRLEAEEQARAWVDGAWIVAFAVTLFAIHLGRMGLDRTALGIVSPGVAVVGDLFIALVVAFGFIIPFRMLWRGATRPAARRMWRWCGTESPSAPGRLARRTARAILTGRMRFAVQMRSARYSSVAAFSRGLQLGLPIAAILAAIVPVSGMSWYFDTENWAAGMWNGWAEQRTDVWRAAMGAAVPPAPGSSGASAYAVVPPGIVNGRDFAFIVIGDTGEGDASQHVLRDQLILASRQDAVRFVVLSSDVVYPTGAMKDYENKFWLPFKGVDRPVYAIPGNHDWYDALEAFAATFLEPDAARAAMRARIEVDKRITSSNERSVDALIARAAFLRQQYGVSTGGQRAPYFQLQTDRFALIAVDTGVLKRVDAAQLRWLEAALEAARGKCTMVVLGHPLFAGGLYQAASNEDFAAIHRLLRKHDVTLAMAGDTHDLESYVERYDAPTGPRTMHHMVNGGGGAYLSFGTALAWPKSPATATWAFYPSRDQVVQKIDALAPAWERPVWWWTRRFNAWPFSAEWLSAAFDFNVAPFFQSFVEVRVEPSMGRLRLLPWGVHGRLRWSDLTASADARPTGTTPDAFVEWALEMPGAGR
jgi:uncharacterized membrane protein HdeD (DUF308 family)/3',5'-cyclic AMP phosphodiesterase CpdA